MGASLPDGFGWLMIFGAFIGAGVGVAYVLLVIWLINRSDKTSADGNCGKGHEQL